MRAPRILGLALVAVLSVLVQPGPARAAGELGLSTDGITWGGTLPGPLFDPAFRWVPGDVETASFFVRNQDPETGVLQVVVADSTVRSLIETGDLEIAARVGDGDYVGVSTTGARTLIESEQIPPDQVRRIDVRVSFDPASTNRSQSKQFNLRLNVTLSQDTSVLPPVDGGGDNNGGGGVAGPDNGTSGGTNGNLPGTGSALSRGLLLLAVILCAGGLGLVGIGRRDRAPKERQTSHA